MKIGRFAIVAVVLVTNVAHAGAREESAAKSALTRARTEHERHHDARAFQILSQAEKSCEPDQCSPTILASLFRDMGATEVLTGDLNKARSNFAAALAFDSAIDLDPAYATNEVRAAWSDVKSPGSQQPSGDFEHTPPAEQKRGVPLPLYLEYSGSAHPASIVVRYEQDGTYRRLALVRVGKGWGNVIPCGAVKLGTLHYYFQGLDSEGLPILDGGDKRHPYSVPIRASIESAPPRLPNHRAPTTCGEGLGDGEEETHEAPQTSEPQTPATPRTFSRAWIGVSLSYDFTVLPSGNDVCAVDSNGSAINASYACTSDTPEGQDFPANQTESATLTSGNAGNVSGGPQSANVRVKATFDYALTDNFLIGGALGFVAAAYGGSASAKFPPVHLEARATYVFGNDPLAHAGFAPYGQLAGGVAEYDANVTTMVSQTSIAGSRPVQAWHVGGPGFVALEGGVRYAFGARSAFLLGFRATAAFGINFFPAFGPAASLQFGL